MQDSREPGLYEQSKHITKQQQDEFLQQANEAAASGDPGRMLEALHRSFILDGLTRRISSKWQKLSRDEVSDIVAEAVDAVYEAIRGGKKVLSLSNYLSSTCHYKACDYYSARQCEKSLTPEDLEHIPDQLTEHEDEPDSSAKELDWEAKRPRAIAIVRSLLPKLGQHNV